jgi:hypothetical protein
MFGGLQNLLILIQENAVAIAPRKLQKEIFFLYKARPEKLFEGAAQNAILEKLLHPGHPGPREVGPHRMPYGKGGGSLFQKCPDLLLRSQGAAVGEGIPAEKESPGGELSLAKSQSEPGISPGDLSGGSGLFGKDL